MRQESSESSVQSSALPEAKRRYQPLAHELLAAQVQSIKAAEHRESHTFGLEEMAGHGHHLVFRDGFDALDDFVEVEEALEVHLLAREVRHARHGAFEREQEIALELVLGAAEFARLERLALEAAEFLHDEVDDLDGAIGRGSGVDAEGAGVAVGREVGVDGVDEATLFADGLEEAGTHAAAEDSVEQESGVAGFVGDGRCGNAEAELNLLERFLVAQVNARGNGGSRVGVDAAAGGERAEVACDHLDEAVVLEIAGGGKDHVAGLEPLLEEADQGVLLEATDGLAGAEDGLAERVAFPEILHEDFVDEGVGTVLVHLDFLEDDAALAGNFFRGENRIEDEVGENIESGRDVLVEHLDVEADGFFAGEGVEIAADGVDFAGDALRGARLGALEDHVLDKVRDAVELGNLMTGANAHPHPHGDGADMLHALGEDDETAGEDSTADIAFAGHGLLGRGQSGPVL
jgi:hypothetical protein